MMHACEPSVLLEEPFKMASLCKCKRNQRSVRDGPSPHAAGRQGEGRRAGSHLSCSVWVHAGGRLPLTRVSVGSVPQGEYSLEGLLLKLNSNTLAT